MFTNIVKNAKDFDQKKHEEEEKNKLKLFKEGCILSNKIETMELFL